MTSEQRRKTFLLASVAMVGALAATTAFAWQSPTKHRYLTNGPLQICDEGTFYVGGAPKITPFASTPTPQGQRQFLIGQMYVQFKVPMVSKSWPLIMVHGSGYSGSCVEGTAGGNESWAEYTVRNGIPTYVVDQSGRGRSGFDHSPIHEAVYKIKNGDIPGALALLPGGGTIPEFGFGHEGTTGWAAWFGHFVPGPSGNFDHNVTASDMIRHGAPGDPLCATEPAHCNQLGRLPMEPEAPWAVDQAIKSRTGNGAPAGLGTITPDNAQVFKNASYLALEAYKFDLPNAELFLPGSTCPSCNPTALNATNTWTPKALAELVVGLGGAIVATHSQSGQIGMNMVRVLKEQGKLNMLKGLMQVEGGSNTAASGTTPADFVNNNIPYLQFKGDYSATSAVSTQLVAAIKALGGKADYIELDQPGWWQGSYAGPFGAGYVGPFAGVSHMMMIEDNPSPAGKATNLQVTSS
jgi:hypothetical protein